VRRGVVFGGGDDFFRDTKGGANFGEREFAVFEELQISGGEPGGEDFIGAPEEQGAVEGARAAAAVAGSGADLLLVHRRVVDQTGQSGRRRRCCP